MRFSRKYRPGPKCSVTVLDAKSNSRRSNKSLRWLKISTFCRGSRHAVSVNSVRRASRPEGCDRGAHSSSIARLKRVVRALLGPKRPSNCKQQARCRCARAAHWGQSVWQAACQGKRTSSRETEMGAPHVGGGSSTCSPLSSRGRDPRSPAATPSSVSLLPSAPPPSSRDRAPPARDGARLPAAVGLETRVPPCKKVLHVKCQILKGPRPTYQLLQSLFHEHILPVISSRQVIRQQP